ncbi:MAG: hypothetical protein IKV62_09330 [Bacteroidales bacterium]|nr:hypothetical protein [Bacteroidales bacterium]
MKKIFIILVLASFAFVCQAQTVQPSDAADKTGKVVGEVYVGTGFPLYKVGTNGSKPMLLLGGEVRYCFPNSPWDIGVGSRIGVIRRIAEGARPMYLSSQHYLLADYNFRLHPNFTLFAGLEAGISNAYDLSKQNNTYYGFEIVGREPFYASRPVSPYFAPRIGFEAWNRLRGTISVGLMDKGDSCVNFRLGYVFGGTKK